MEKMRLDSDTSKTVENTIRHVPHLMEYLNEKLDTLHNPVSRPGAAKTILHLLLFAKPDNYVL